MTRKTKRTFHPSLAPSPLRYPGGKSWLIPRVEKWLRYIQAGTHSHFVEPFAGGANVGLTMLSKGKIGRLTIVELDKRIAAFWKLALKDPRWLVAQIRSFKPTRANLLLRLRSRSRGFRELGFRTFLQNRTSRGGIIAPRAGILRRGERDRGLFSRWYPETLIGRIEHIERLSDSITLIEGDGVKLLRKRRRRRNDVFFIDPPYSFSANGAGRRLYARHDVQHEKVLQASSSLSGHFLLTYDVDEAIAKLAKEQKLAIATVKMKNSHHSPKKELLISDDLRWLKRPSKKRPHRADR